MSTILTWNMQGWEGEDSQKAANLNTYISVKKPDIVCLQECAKGLLANLNNKQILKEELTDRYIGIRTAGLLKVSTSMQYYVLHYELEKQILVVEEVIEKDVEDIDAEDNGLRSDKDPNSNSRCSLAILMKMEGTREQMIDKIKNLKVVILQSNYKSTKPLRPTIGIKDTDGVLYCSMHSPSKKGFSLKYLEDVLVQISAQKVIVGGDFNHDLQEEKPELKSGFKVYDSNRITHPGGKKYTVKKKDGTEEERETKDAELDFFVAKGLSLKDVILADGLYSEATGSDHSAVQASYELTDDVHMEDPIESTGMVTRSKSGLKDS